MKSPDDKETARTLLREWKGDSYAFGSGVLDSVGPLAGRFGKSAVVIVTELGREWIEEPKRRVLDSLHRQGLSSLVVAGAGPNTPLEDLYRIALNVCRSKAEVIVAVGGGSTIDAGKAAAVLNTYTRDEVAEILASPAGSADGIGPYFGMGLASRLQQATGRTPLPLVAVQTASSSGAHLTKYANITDFQSRQKKLIVDEAIVPRAAVFDFGLTLSSPRALSIDGGLDGFAHIWEVFMGVRRPDLAAKVRTIAEPGLRLLASGLRLIAKDPSDVDGRASLGLGTDLGAYAIMIGGTSGPHLGSFSLVHVLSHGRACALLLPYYTVLFAPVIQDQLRIMANVLEGEGLLDCSPGEKGARPLALAVAKALVEFLKTLDFPTTLKEAGADLSDVERMIEAARDPALKMKLQNMPIPMDAARGDVDRLMAPVLDAAYSGDFDLIPQLAGRDS